MQFMQILTSLVLAAFAGYVGAWYMGAIEGNFALLLFLATVVTGAYWLAERMVFLPRRRRAAQAIEDAAVQRRAELDRMGIQKVDVDVQEAKGRILMQPWWLDWTAGLFPVIAAVFFLRSFLFEPFKIPSGSMIPTLLIGDLIVVNKYTYGLKVPIANTRLTQGEPVKRGDVVVFRYPPNPNMDFIKRVIGLPGDKISYLNKQLMLNGQPVPQQKLDDFFDKDLSAYFEQYTETLGDHAHRIIVDPKRAAFIGDTPDFPLAQKSLCQYSVTGVSCEVPPGHYFVMGDNRDNSADSRYWGFVPDQNIVGKAVVVWMNFGNPSRIGTIQ
jgi:signal peptidase I